MKGKKIIGLLLVLVIVISSLVACNTSPTTTDAHEQAETTDTEKPVTLTLLADKNTSIAGLEAFTKLAEEKLGIKTEFEIHTGGSEGDNLVKTRLATGTMNDICLYNNGSFFWALEPEKYFEDLSDQPYIDQYDEIYKKTVSVGDKTYGIPATPAQGGAWIYNKKVYKELGLEVPETWDELVANCDRIKAAGKTAVIGSYKDSWTSQVIFLCDAYSILHAEPDFAEKLTANETSYAETPATVRTFEKLYEMAPYLNEDYLSTTYEMAIEMLATGQGVHYPMKTQAFTSVYELYPDKIDDIGVFAQPGDTVEDTGLTVYYPLSMYLNKDCKNKEAAKEWFALFMSQEGQDAYGSAIKADGPLVVKGLKIPGDPYEGVLEMQKYFDEGKTAAALEFLTPVRGFNLMDITVQCGSGMITPEEAAIEYDKDNKKSAQQQGLEGW